MGKLLYEFDRLTALAHELYNLAKKLQAAAERLEDRALQEAGIIYHDREPGFNGWTYEGAGHYYACPREAVEARNREQEVK